MQKYGKWKKNAFDKKNLKLPEKEAQKRDKFNIKDPYSIWFKKSFDGAPEEFISFEKPIVQVLEF